ncbi:MAG TPA: sugar ABC transporter ATP-binding protein [Lachnospiraceae bacterium]|nr:sugar ABC transporter ATP-binding protein [Lachnospiraceae bacterium]
MADKKDNIVLSIRDMSKSFGRNRVLTRINLDVKAGTVMGLMGENGAGKSTMMKCLFGTYQKDEGNIFLDGKEVSFSGPREALENGIAMVHQELNQCLERNVVDNLFLGRYPVNAVGVIDEGRMKKEASELFRKLGMTVNLSQPMRNMSVSQRQMCEIAKAISYNSKVIVLDEPTSSLTVQEVEKLFEMMRMLKEQGIALIYISHKMDEIFEICDEISVLRDGNLVMTKSTEDTDMNELITAMVGRSLENRFPEVDNTPGDVVLSVQHLSTKFEPYLKDVSFDVKKGEIFGLYGLVGAGRTELMETIFGVRTRAAGRVYFNNHLMNFESAKDAMEHGFAMITEERKANGLFLKGDLTFNTTIANLKQYKSGIALSDSKMEKATAEEIKTMRTKCMGPNDMISNLSGGNQQKVIFGKWLEREPQVFMMDEPTRGIDVGAKYEIYDLIIQMAKQGKTIIVVSSEMPEILGITNRIGVMSNGRLAGIVNTKETNQEELLRLSAKYL